MKHPVEQIIHFRCTATSSLPCSADINLPWAGIFIPVPVSNYHTNHVHVAIGQSVLEDGSPFPLPKITQSWKRHSSTQIKKALGISENIWQPESYDHVIRNETELAFYLEYTVNNPVRAGLVKVWKDWEFNWLNPLFGSE